MRLLIWYVEEFGYTTTEKGNSDAEDCKETRMIKNAVVGFIHAEEHDEENFSSVETKMIKQLKWAAKKNVSNIIILHSFAHLAKTKASAAGTKNMLDNAEKRLADSGYEVYQTPFGYYLDLNLKAPGHSLARIYKEF